MVPWTIVPCIQRSQDPEYDEQVIQISLISLYLTLSGALIPWVVSYTKLARFISTHKLSLRCAICFFRPGGKPDIRAHGVFYSDLGGQGAKSRSHYSTNIQYIAMSIKATSDKPNKCLVKSSQPQIDDYDYRALLNPFHIYLVKHITSHILIH